MESEKIRVMSLLPKDDQLSIDYKEASKISEASPILVGGIKEIQIEEMDLRDIQNFLYLHPVVPRGIEIKANKIVGRGYTINGPHLEANSYIVDILKESGGIVFLKKFTENGWAFGNAYAELIPNKEQSKILKCDLLHPVYFNFAKKKVYSNGRETWHKIINPLSKKPIGFQQYHVKNDKLEPYGPIIPDDRIMHLAFDTWGDDTEGVPVIRYLKSILTHLLVLERAAGVSGERTANPRYKFTTEITQEPALKKFAKAVDNINERDAIILTKGNDVDVLSPGNTNFNEYHDKFLNLVAVKLGIPKSILYGDGTSTNKATLTEMTNFMHEENRADEEILRQVIQTQLIEPAIEMKYGNKFKKEDMPIFNLQEFAGDESLIYERLHTMSTIVNNLVSSVQMLKSVEEEEAATSVLKYLQEEILNKGTGRFLK